MSSLRPRAVGNVFKSFEVKEKKNPLKNSVKDDCCGKIIMLG